MDVAQRVLAFSLFSLLIPFQQAFGIGFDLGSNYQAIQLGGQVELFCTGDGNNRSDWAVHYCSNWTLDPGETAFLLVDPAIGADRFTLKNDDGKDQVVRKKGRFLPNTGRSTVRVNLWINTLSQEPLLRLGTNVIQYELFAGAQLKDSGTFTVEVTEGEARTCQSKTFYFRSPSECTSPSLICWEYFSGENYCRYQ